MSTLIFVEEIFFIETAVSCWVGCGGRVYFLVYVMMITSGREFSWCGKKRKKKLRSTRMKQGLKEFECVVLRRRKRREGKVE